MEYQEAGYIINYFPRLMTEIESKANRHNFCLSHLGKPEDYESLSSYEFRRSFFIKRNGISSEADVLRLLDDGYSNFVLKTAIRIEKDTPNQYKINKCPKCKFIARTPYAKQCRKCRHDWHNEISGELSFNDSFKITGRPYLWITGVLVKGHAQVGNRIDLTFSQLNIITEIKQIGSCSKLVDGVQKNLSAFGIEVDNKQEELIKKYLIKSAKTIMILKE